MWAIQNSAPKGSETLEQETAFVVLQLLQATQKAALRLFLQSLWAGGHFNAGGGHLHCFLARSLETLRVSQGFRVLGGKFTLWAEGFGDKQLQFEGLLIRRCSTCQ